MARIIVLDTTPLGLASKPRGKPDGDRCRAWLTGIAAAGARVVVPEIADYEVRRELIRNNATAGLGRLDRLGRALEYAAITTAVMREAAELWAQARRAGIPTADPKALDGDCILAAQALLAGGATDDVTVATSNVGHLGRFVDAQLWESIT